MSQIVRCRVDALLFSLLLCVCAPTAAAADDWPQWRGPARDGKSAETGLLKAWPAGGPDRVWKTTGAGLGYSSVAVRGDTLYTVGKKGKREVVTAFVISSGGYRWFAPLGPSFESERGSGPRGTPTIDGEHLYVLGSEGHLACMKSANGHKVWEVDILDRFGADNIRWGLSESVLVVDGKVICAPGGHDAGVVALDAKTGATVWTSKGYKSKAGYASAVVAKLAGIQQVVHFNHSSAVGVRLSDGAPLWTYEGACNGVANCTTPTIVGDSVFLTSDYGQGSAMLRILPGDEAIGAAETYFTKKLQNHHGGVILHEGHIYGHSGGNSERQHQLVCLEAKTGSVKWTHKGPGKCSIVFAEGMLYCLSEKGVMALVEANPARYVEHGRFIFKSFKDFKLNHMGDKDEKPTWAHPVIAGKKLYLRDQNALFCYDLAAK